MAVSLGAGRYKTLLRQGKKREEGAAIGRDSRHSFKNAAVSKNSAFSPSRSLPFKTGEIYPRPKIENERKEAKPADLRQIQGSDIGKAVRG
jgi:hypothetical protein